MAELVQTSQKFSVLREVLEKRQGDIAKAIPRGIDAQRFTRVALSNFQIKPALLDCTPASVFTAVMQAAAWGLELDPMLGQAYLVPYKDRRAGVTLCTLQLGYRGMLALARRSGDIASFLPGVVHAKDDFTYKRVGRRPDGSLGTVLEHVEYSGKEDPGEVIATYIVMFLTNGSEQIDVMYRREIDARRARSRSKDEGPWVTDFDAMALKSVVRQASKFWPLETSVAAAINQDELIDLGVETPVMPALEAGEPDAAVDKPKGLNALIEKPRVAPEVPATPAVVEAKSATPELSQAEYEARMAELRRQVAEEEAKIKAMAPKGSAALDSGKAEPTDADLDREIAEQERKLEAERQQAMPEGRTAEEQARERSRREQSSAHEMPRAHREAAKKPAAQPSMIEREPGQEG